MSKAMTFSESEYEDIVIRGVEAFEKECGIQKLTAPKLAETIKRCGIESRFSTFHARKPFAVARIAEHNLLASDLISKSNKPTDVTKRLSSTNLVKDYLSRYNIDTEEAGVKLSQDVRTLVDENKKLREKITGLQSALDHLMQKKQETEESSVTDAFLYKESKQLKDENAELKEMIGRLKKEMREYEEKQGRYLAEEIQPSGGKNQKPVLTVKHDKPKKVYRFEEEG